MSQTACLTVALDSVKRPFTHILLLIFLFLLASVATRRLLDRLTFARLQPHGKVTSWLHDLTVLALMLSSGGHFFILLVLALVAACVSIWVDVLAVTDPEGELVQRLVLVAAWAMPVAFGHAVPTITLEGHHLQRMLPFAWSKAFFE